MTSETPLRLGDHVFTARELLSLLDSVADGIVVRDHTGEIVYANPAAARVLGFASREELMRTGPDQLMQAFTVTDEAGKALQESELPGRRALEGATEQERLVRVTIGATGDMRWSMIRAMPAFDEAGKVRFTVSIWHDVTERVLRQNALEESTVELEEVSSELEETIVELQAQTAEAKAAGAAAEYTAERQRFLAEAGRMLSTSLDPEATLRTITKLAVPRIADWCTISLVDADGTLKPLEVAHSDPEKLRVAQELQDHYPPDDVESLRVVRTGQSELYATVPDELLARSARDAEHLRLLRELRLQSAMLVPLKIRKEVLGVITFIGAESGRTYGPDDLEFAESLAARAALALSNARLHKQTQEANRAKSDFLAVMSHELRTPLTAIFGYTELLSTGITGPVTQNQVTQLERIRGSAAHLLGIIEDILSYARAEAGQESLQTEPVRVSGVVAEAVAIVQPEAARKQLDLRSDIEHDAILNTDRGKLRQILVNLLGNAVKFTNAGSVGVIAYRDGEQVVIRVDDTGVGIAAGDLDRIFEPFQQLQSATTRSVGGTGLGLAVSRRFAQLLGGTLTVTSTLGKGTSFSLTIPVNMPA